MAKKDNIASVLAFEKKLVASDGYMFGTVWGDRTQISPLQLQEKSVRGTISNRFKATDTKAFEKDPAKLNAKVVFAEVAPNTGETLEAFLPIVMPP